MTEGLARLNAMDADEAEAALRRCLDVAEWAGRVTAARPFADRRELFVAAERAWDDLGPDAWREAMEGHPRLGGDDLRRDRFAETRAWSAREQSGLAGSPRAVREALAEAQTAYERRFGHVFLIHAAGLDGERILEALRERISNDPERELEVAAGELQRIARERLDRMLDEEEDRRS